MAKINSNFQLHRFAYALTPNHKENLLQEFHNEITNTPVFRYRLASVLNEKMLSFTIEMDHLPEEVRNMAKILHFYTIEDEEDSNTTSHTYSDFEGVNWVIKIYSHECIDITIKPPFDLFKEQSGNF